MPRYRVTFTGRTRGAIGISYPISIVVQAIDPKDAKIKAYDTHEHCHGIQVTEIPEEPKQ